MLSRFAVNEIEKGISIDIMKDLSDRLIGFKVNKNNPNWETLSKDILTANNEPYMFMEVPYKIEFGRVYHKNGIGNNNEWPIYMTSQGTQFLVGYFSVIWPIYGDNCTAFLRDITGEQVLP